MSGWKVDKQKSCENHNAALEFLDYFSESIDGVHIKMVRRFIKNQDVRMVSRVVILTGKGGRS